MAANTHNTRRHIWLIPLKIVAWTVIAVVLFSFGTLIAAVRTLSPDRLTPLTEELANRALNADVSVSSVSISLRGSYPFLDLDVDSLVIISRDIRRLPESARDTLPAWADTLACVEHLHGGINIVDFLHDKIVLRNLDIRQPQINILVVNESLNNFSITKSHIDSLPREMPSIRLDRFRLTDPRSIKYADLSQGSYLEANVRSAVMTDTPVPSSELPLYRMDFSTNISSPVFRIIGRTSIPVALDGIVEWDHKAPYGLGLHDLRFDVCGIAGVINTYMTFNDRLTIHSFDFAFDPMDINTLLAMISAGFANASHLPTRIDTDARLQCSGHITAPYTTGADVPPVGVLTLGLPECSAVWDGVKIDTLALQTTLRLRGNSIDDAVLDISRLTLRGEGIAVDARGYVTHIATDPAFNASIKAAVDIAHLPGMDTRRSVLRGRLTADTDIHGRASMLSYTGFHRLAVNGDVAADNVYYLGADTLSMVDIRHAVARLGNRPATSRRHSTATDSLLHMHISIDSAAMLAKGMDIRLGGMDLDMGAVETAPYSDTTLVVPMSGSLRLRRFSAYTLGIADGLTVYGCKGAVTMRRRHGDQRLPQFDVDLTMPRVMAGTPQTHFYLDNAHLKASLGQTSHQTKADTPVATASATGRRAGYISPDSVYILAEQISARGPHHPRIHLIHNKSHEEMIDWGTSHIFARFLTHWLLSGTLTAPSGDIRATWITLPNHIADLKVSFNDSDILLAGVKYSMGHSDFDLSGTVRNMKRAFINRNWSKALKIDFDLHSHMIDIDQLIATYNAFSAPAPGDSAAVAAAAQESAAWLIPINLDAGCAIHADRVLYSGIVFTDAHGMGSLGDGKVCIDTLLASTSAGTIGFSGAYCAQRADSLGMEFDMQVADFNIAHFTRLVPTLDSIMPVLRHLQGTVNAQVSAHSLITPKMHLVLPSFVADIHLEGDSLGMKDSEKFREIKRWLLLKHNESDLITHLAANMSIRDEKLQVMPFVFDFNRYRLGVYGYNTLDMDFDYHIAVLKSPIPFRFGIDIVGNPHHHKIHFGGTGLFSHTR